MNRKDVFDVTDRVIVITGALGQIGRQFALEFIDRGARVAVFNRRIPDEATLRERFPVDTGRVMFCTVDITDKASIQAGLSQVETKWAVPHVLINNAGIADYDLINVITPARWRRLFAVNVDGAFYCIRAALPHMLQQQSGCIINVSSMWGQVGASCEAAYSATKGAILALTKALAQELGPSGIRVNAVAPGVIRTDMCASVDPAVMEDLRQQTPIGRAGTPEDIAGAVGFLVSPAAAYVTGTTVHVNGGMFMD